MRSGGQGLDFLRAMSRRVRVFVILVVLLVAGVGIGVWRKVKREPPSYESAFAEYIWVEYPEGTTLKTFESYSERMDSILREREAGYLAGVTSRGDPPEVLEVELAVNLDTPGIESLIEEFKMEGLVPKGISFSAGAYPRTGLLEEDLEPVD